MTTKDLQKKINNTFKSNFGYTPLNERLHDLQREFFELMKWQDVKNLKEETGDLLASLIQLCNESDWYVDELVLNTLHKIDRRADQYKLLTILFLFLSRRLSKNDEVKKD